MRFEITFRSNELLRLDAGHRPIAHQGRAHNSFIGALGREALLV
jgi:hypothetical protein